MTEAGEHGVDSVCQLLALLCLADELSPLFAPTEAAAQQRSRVAMALLAEAVSRSCRVLLRTAPPVDEAKLELRSGQSRTMLVARRLVRRALGVAPESCAHPQPDAEPEPAGVAHSAAYALPAALKASGEALQ